jgi:Skp family chaperone for outer membrane proteins
MRKTVIFLGMFAGLLFASAAQAAEMRIVFFNMGVVAEKSVAYKDNLDKLKKEFEPEGQKLQKEAEAFQKKVNDFQVQMQALSPEARTDREASLTTEKRNLDDKMNAYSRKRQIAEKRAEEEIQRVVAYAVNELAKREQYSAVLEQNLAGALLVDARYDISDALVKEADAVWKEKPKAIFGDGK